jgi:flagellar protein FlaG
MIRDPANSIGTPRPQTATPARAPRETASPQAAAEQRTAVAGSGQASPPAPEPVDVSKVVEQLNRYVQSVSRDLSFSVDEATGRTVIRVLDSATQQVIREIPPENARVLARMMEAMGDDQSAAGLLLQGEV